MELDYASLFAGTAPYYRKYRRPYPHVWLDEIRDFFNLDGTGKLLDLGCGTGELAVPLSKYVTEVIGIDPSSDMLAEAKLRAKEEGSNNCMWVQGKAEEIDASYGPIRLVTSGVSFQWFKQAIVLQKVFELLETGGGMVIIGDASPVRGRSKTEPWMQVRQRIIEKYLGPARKAGTALHADFIPERIPIMESIVASPFKTAVVHPHTYETRRSFEQILGFLYSTSYSARRHFGSEVEKFESELKEELMRLVPDGVFIEPGKAEIFFLRKE